jgi:hypothetical protein
VPPAQYQRSPTGFYSPIYQQYFYVYDPWNDPHYDFFVMEEPIEFSEYCQYCDIGYIQPGYDYYGSVYYTDGHNFTEVPCCCDCDCYTILWTHWSGFAWDLGQWVVFSEQTWDETCFSFGVISLYTL